MKIKQTKFHKTVKEDLDGIEKELACIVSIGGCINKVGLYEDILTHIRNIKILLKEKKS
jgi:hypothetical protein